MEKPLVGLEKQEPDEFLDLTKDLSKALDQLEIPDMMVSLKFKEKQVAKAPENKTPKKRKNNGGLDF